ncbi:MAG: hypothetical protein OHK0046_12440 [Anaerolineae bacterium]
MITIHLPDALMARASEVADRTAREVEEVLLEWLDRSADDIPIESLSDEEVLVLCEYELNPLHQYELRALLHRPLTLDESRRLDELLQIYRRGIIRKARALQVATARGLRDRTAS